MIELEIQGLSGNREGLLIEVGRIVAAHEFTLQRQRLVQDPHGILLTMIVRGSPRRRRALEEALDGCERFISVKVFPFAGGDPQPHFAASIKRAEPVRTARPAPAAAAPTPAATPTPAAAPVAAEPPAPVAPPVPEAPAVAAEPPPEPAFEFILPTPRPPAPAPAVDTMPFVEQVPLAPDEAAVEKALASLDYDYPRIVPRLLALCAAVAEGARESSLALAGRRTGAWVFGREYAEDTGLGLQEAIDRIGAPALRALVEADPQGTQLHIRDSPFCTEDGHSGCAFFSGFLEGLLGPAVAPGGLSIFPVCCRSYGADECVLAISD